MVEAKLLPPIHVFLEDPEFAGSHSVEHHHQARFDGHAAVLELRVVGQHIQALVPILFSKCDAGALKRFPLAISGPTPTEIAAPETDSRSVLNRRCLFQSVTAGDINDIALSVPNQLDRSKGMLPAEIHSADTRPMAWEVAVLASNLDFLDREYSTATKNWNALSTTFTFMGRIAVDNLLSFFRRVMQGFLDSHADNDAVG